MSVQRWHLDRARSALERGGIVAYPTEAVYGLGCDPLNAAAVRRLLGIKRRRADKGLILIASQLAHILPYLDISDGMQGSEQSNWNAMLSSWPGPVTWVAPAADWVPKELTGGRRTIAVRLTDHPIAAALSNAFDGAIVSTSANRSGCPPAKNALEIRCRLSNSIDALVAGPTGALAGPTEIRDVLTGAVLRPALNTDSRN